MRPTIQWSAAVLTQTSSTSCSLLWNSASHRQAQPGTAGGRGGRTVRVPHTAVDRGQQPDKLRGEPAGRPCGHLPPGCRVAQAVRTTGRLQGAWRTLTARFIWLK